MTVERLQESINDTGLASTVVFLKREHVAASPDHTKVKVHVGADGRVTRLAAPVKAPVMADLEQHFVPPDGAESAPGKMTHLPFLEAVHGVVDQKGLDKLIEHDATHSLHHAPDHNVIKPVMLNAVDSPPPGETWGLQFLNVAAVWQQGYTGRNIVVAHLDSGVDSRHEALRGSIEACAKFDLNGNAVEPPDPYQGLDDHGTHTAGTVAGRQVDGAPIIGVAPDVELIDATIAGKGASMARVLAGMNWSLGKGARVMSLSIGSRRRDEAYIPVIDKLREQQLLPVVAIGNDRAGHTRCPGNLKSVLSVGSVDKNGNVEPDSSSAKANSVEVGPKLCAPGVLVLSAKRFGGYFESSGTSMAAPHVAGLAALLLSAKPTATIDDVERAIIRSCRNPQNESKDRIGAGIPDAVAALGELA
jgi:subtilisin